MKSLILMDKNRLVKLLLIGGMITSPTALRAQLSQNPDKFLGNITTRGQVNWNGVEFISLWNQLTPENETKWESIEGTRDKMNWWGADNCYNYCKKNKIPFKLHCLVWGSQYPKWITSLSKEEQYEEIIEWLDELKARYPSIEMIDVVNEAVPGHAPAPFKDAIGGDGSTGYDWIIRSFQLAHERWPEAILIYNDYNTFQWQTSEFINLVKTLRDAGAPIDAYGCQSHDLTDINFSSFKSVMERIQNSLKMPMYSSEYDIGTSDDQIQLRQYRDQIKYMWEKEYVAGITLWGYVYGCTWTTDGNSGIIRDGVDRPAMTWLREYMESDEAQTAKGPFPNCKKEASVYIRPSSLKNTINEEMSIYIDATLHNATIDRVELYIGEDMVAEFNDAPYIYTYIPEALGRVDTKAVVYDTAGNTYLRYGGHDICKARAPFNGQPQEIPGIIEAENFDIGGEGLTYHDSDNRNEGTKGYRNDSEGVDIVEGSTGYVIGYTAQGEWLEYTVDVLETGMYDFEATVSSGLDGSAFSLSLVENGTVKDISGHINVPNNGNWDKYTTVSGSLISPLEEGRHILRATIQGSYVNLDKISFTKSAGVADCAADITEGKYEVFTSIGIKVGSVDISSRSDAVEAVGALTRKAGVYLLRNNGTGKTFKVHISQGGSR